MPEKNPFALYWLEKFESDLKDYPKDEYLPIYTCSSIKNLINQTQQSVNKTIEKGERYGKMEIFISHINQKPSFFSSFGFSRPATK